MSTKAQRPNASSNDQKWPFVIGLLLVAFCVGSLAALPARVPDVALTLINEEPTTLGELRRDQPTLVLFWATDCKPCVEEVPLLVRLYREYHPRGLNMLAVAMAHDPPARVWQFMQDRALPYHVSLDLDSRIANAFGGVDAIPVLFLLNADGGIVYSHHGTLPLETLETLIRELIAIDAA